ncbi:MAG: (2Fe-2S)-binding protein, partial [Mesorhizobium sp.]
IGLTGAKEGCGTGDCGACSVIVDGRLVCSCLVLGAEAEGRKVETIEGMAHGDQLHPLQQKFLEHAALQCGVCTPGFLIAAKDLLEKNPSPTEEEIRFGLAGNLCRCTGYEAIMRAAHAISSYGKAAKDPLAVERKDITARLKALRDGARVEIGSGKARLI